MSLCKLSRNKSYNEKYKSINTSKITKKENKGFKLVSPNELPIVYVVVAQNGETLQSRRKYGL